MELAKTIIPKLAGLKSWNSRTSKIWKLTTTFVFNTFTGNMINMVKTATKQELLMQPFQQTCATSASLIYYQDYAWVTNYRDHQPLFNIATIVFNTNMRHLKHILCKTKQRMETCINHTSTNYHINKGSCMHVIQKITLALLYLSHHLRSLHTKGNHIKHIHASTN
jgi:hypothetical protein